MLPSGCAIFPAGTKPETMINFCYVGQSLLENFRAVHSDKRKDKVVKIIVFDNVHTMKMNRRVK